jgi:hypothetical protein
MGGYLDQYGAGDERRSRIIKRIIICVAAAGLLTLLLLAVFHNVRQERRVKQFFALLAARDYKSAYALWGCTDERPCRDYPMGSFMDDWGSQAIPAAQFEVLYGESCGSGVIVDVDAGKAGSKKLWVENSSLVIGFPPPGMERCPQGNRIGDWLRGIKYRLHGRTYQP